MEYTAILYFKAAYDCVTRAKILNRYDQYPPPNEVAMVLGSFQPIHIRTFNTYRQHKHAIEIGIQQNFPLSPDLFNMITDTLSEQMQTVRQHNNEYTHYADTTPDKDVTMFVDDVKL